MQPKWMWSSERSGPWLRCRHCNARVQRQTGKFAGWWSVGSGLYCATGPKVVDDEGISRGQPHSVREVDVADSAAVLDWLDA